MILPTCSVAGGVCVLVSNFSRGSMKSAHGPRFEGCDPKWREESSIQRKKKKSPSPSPIICQLLLGRRSPPPSKSRDAKFLLPSLSMAGMNFNASATVGVCGLGFTETLTSSVTAHPEPNSRLTDFFFFVVQVDTVLLHAKRLQLYSKCICSSRFCHVVKGRCARFTAPGQ